ncbi:hypothetical protein DW352_03510 [Pseudolabrys taiwanensis]|uniref:Uncharacterized protein n=1 Tax=Pseudolabrys taiwanensis TaxID=331696 RepID=A0A345ZRW9_9HYPH|nr:hypothetical protein [Pseudolabrys taiwanensis]AXK79666.1 hypothetical protein DW352_03510 [Pseudolabrys taiwanensis]
MLFTSCARLCLAAFIWILVATTQSHAASPEPTVIQTQAAPPAPAGAQEQQIGQWRIATQNGRLTAIAKSEKPYSDKLAGLWIECAPGGRLEYVAISLGAMFKDIRALWIDSAGDVYTIPLQKGRATGQAAINIAKQLLAEERAYLSQGQGDKWSMQMSIDSASGPMSDMQLGGFSKARAYMLANCKS